MGLFDKMKERKAAKEAAAAEEARFAQVAEKCEKDFESYKMFTIANQAKVGTVETRTSNNEAERYNITTIHSINGTKVEKELVRPDLPEQTVKTTIAYTSYGPVVKRNVHEVKKEGNINVVNDYTTYEGYIKTGENTEALAGYFKIKHTELSLPNPIERETYYFQNYEGVNRDPLGNVKEFNDRVEAYGHSGEYGNIVKTFEACIKENIQKMQANQQVQK